VAAQWRAEGGAGEHTDGETRRRPARMRRQGLTQVPWHWGGGRWEAMWRYPTAASTPWWPAARWRVPHSCEREAKGERWEVLKKSSVQVLFTETGDEREGRGRC
jgi:hypothetical protein